MAAEPKYRPDATRFEVVAGGVLSIRIDAVFVSSLVPSLSTDQYSTTVMPSADISAPPGEAMCTTESIL